MLVFTDILDYPKRNFKEEGYISGLEYCETTHPISKGELQIQVYKPCLGSKIHLSGMTCRGCLHLLRKAVEELVHSMKIAPHSTFVFLEKLTLVRF